MQTSNTSDPAQVQENLYSLPYHWFPEIRLAEFDRIVRKKIIFYLLIKHSALSAEDYLDVGCGDGKWTTDICRLLAGDKKVNAVGIDISERAVGFAKLISPFINFETYSGDKFPFSANSFDLVSCIEVIEHIPDSCEEIFVQELFRVIKSGGKLLLTTPSVNQKVSAHHFRHYSVDRLMNLLSNAGFTNIEIMGHSIQLSERLKWLRRWSNHLPFVWMIWKFSYKQTNLRRALNLILIAEKNK